MGEVIDNINAKLDNIDLPSGYHFSWGGEAEMFEQMVKDLLFAFLLAIILTYMLLAAILESFWQPVLILITLPLALIGVFIIMFYTETTMNLTSMMGIIMLIGIVVNNAILILDYTNQLVREEHMSIREALIKACPTKLKAIVMATLAIILGLLPMALGIGDAGKEMRQPLGIVSIGGLVASTFLTLYVVPACYYLVTSFIKFVNRIFRRGKDNYAEMDKIYSAKIKVVQ
jgi:HAE1 family hydrophobic/amphiphilic exporter-1